ncbi:MAG TPA: hypothetical protein VKY15_03075 [Acidimicrobiales bacterium]|jgi:hypothetical protein|nr:hypothetical protein [Acidimicrobiales bacterium]
MSPAHKAALAAGREQGRAVRLYLEALETAKPRRGRKRTPESIKRQLDSVVERLANADPLTRLHLLQTKRDLEEELASKGTGADLAAREAEFIKVAKSYGERKSISYAAWREAGVPASVLQKAGIQRGSGA